VGKDYDAIVAERERRERTTLDGSNILPSKLELLRPQGGLCAKSKSSQDRAPGNVLTGALGEALAQPVLEKRQQAAVLCAKKPKQAFDLGEEPKLLKQGAPVNNAYGAVRSTRAGSKGGGITLPPVKRGHTNSKSNKE